MKTINQVFSAIECFFTLVFKFNKFHSIKKNKMVNPSEKLILCFYYLGFLTRIIHEFSLHESKCVKSRFR